MLMLRRALRALGNQLVVFLLLRVRVWVKGYFIDRRLARDSQDVERVQRELLLKILGFHRNTEYGVKHGFAGIASVGEYRNRVPVNDYEDLRPWFEKQEKEGTLAINAEHPVLYTLTSGTTGKPKLIPVLASTLENNKRIQNFYLNYMFRARPRVADGRILTIVSAAVEGHTENARTPFGATTGHMYAAAPKIAQKKYIVPPPIFDVADYDTRFALILRLALLSPDITYMTTANPTTFIRLVNLLNERWDEWMTGLETGGFTAEANLTEEQREIVAKKLIADPKRARELRALRASRRDGRVRFRDVWPDIQAVGVWTGGSCGIFFDRLKDEFGPATLIRDAGYHSSEFRGSSPIFTNTTAGVPTFREQFFEFAPRDGWDAGDKNTFLGLHELQDGSEYYIFVTTDAGLYRYNMNDVVKVEGFHNQVPLLRFLQKGKGVTSITGEKLYETQVIAAARETEAALSLRSVFYMMIADENAAEYTLFYEPAPECALAATESAAEIAKLADDSLGRINIEYQAKRASGRLAPLKTVVLAAGAYEAYKRFCIAGGQRESQFKIVALNYAKDMKFDFAAHAAAAPAPRQPLRTTAPAGAREAVQVS